MTTQSIAEIFDLKGKAAIVTGGAMGIGEAITFRLAVGGASVMIADISLEAANKVVDQIKSRGGKAEAIYADAGSANDARKVAQATVDTFGRLDILVNNAGIFPFSPALETTEALWDKVLGINLKGAFFFAQAASQQMIKVGHGGKIINIASILGLVGGGDPGRAPTLAYNTTKGGVISFTRSLAVEWAQYTINVNATAPGFFPTKMTRGVLAAAGDAIAERAPLRRVGGSEDIKGLAALFASDASAFITGQTVAVDGGATAA